MRLLPALAGAALLFASEAEAGPKGKPDPDLRKALTAAIHDSHEFRDRYAAEVWFTDMSARLQRYVPRAMPDAKKRLRFLKILHAEAARADVPPELVLAVIDVESRFDRFAISSTGAQGLMQIMPFWLKETGAKADNLFQPEVNLRLGCTILKFYLDREKGDKVRALARYSGSGKDTQYSYKVLSALSARWYRS